MPGSTSAAVFRAQRACTFLQPPNCPLYISVSRPCFDIFPAHASCPRTSIAVGQDKKSKSSLPSGACAPPAFARLPCMERSRHFPLVVYSLVSSNTPRGARNMADERSWCLSELRETRVSFDMSSCDTLATFIPLIPASVFHYQQLLVVHFHLEDIRRLAKME